VAKRMVSASEVRAALAELRARTGWSNSELMQVLRPATASSKGSSFEREFAVQLGLWWCGREDAFWRSSGSGGRANMRHRAGRDTAGQFGDIAATIPEGQPLIDCITFELKRGYTEAHIGGLFDSPPGARDPELAAFFAQAELAHKQAWTTTWAVVHKRDRREAVLWVPYEFAVLLKKHCGLKLVPDPILVYQDTRVGRVIGCHLSWFFANVRREHIEGISNAEE